MFENIDELSFKYRNINGKFIQLANALFQNPGPTIYRGFRSHNMTVQATQAMQPN
jgi:hypothetical protein